MRPLVADLYIDLYLNFLVFVAALYSGGSCLLHPLCCDVRCTKSSDCQLWNVGMAIYTVKLSPRVSIIP